MTNTIPANKLSVYNETNDIRKLVGELSRSEKGYTFQYHEKWLVKPRAIPLGPDLPLSMKPQFSKTLFPTFVDRIPNRNSANYLDYCKVRGINPNESDVIILLGTIGHRGPSTFVFEISNHPLRLRKINTIITNLLSTFSYRQVGTLLNINHSVLQDFQKKIKPDTLMFNYLEASFQSPKTFEFRIATNQQLTDLIGSHFLKWLQDNRSLFDLYNQETPPGIKGS